MSKNWKGERAEAAIKEGTDKIMKAAQELSKKEETLFPEKLKKANKTLKNTKLPKQIKSLEELTKNIETRIDLVSNNVESKFNEKMFNDGYLYALNWVLNQIKND